MERSYWVVSPNVNGSSSGKLDSWQKAIPKVKAAFMGWPPKKIPRDTKKQGPAFANKIDLGDVILIAQGNDKSAGLLACGVVASEALVDAKGKRPAKLPADLDYGSCRILSPFKELEANEIPFDGASQTITAIYKLHPQTNKADRKVCARLNDKLHITFEVEEAPEEEGYFEDPRRHKVHINIERRNSALVKRVKEIHGYSCEACDLKFEDRYPALGDKSRYIEAHHLQPISTLKGKKLIKHDPRTDFAVLCANCHRMIHRTAKPWDLAGFKKVLTKIKW
jgi:HNH endonuclease